LTAILFKIETLRHKVLIEYKWDLMRNILSIYIITKNVIDEERHFQRM
jgi:hypothetical protein